MRRRSVLPVEAILVAGGLGTRLRPLTETRPKHLLPVAGVPFLTHQIVKLARSGVRRIVLATSYRAEEFEPVFGGGEEFGVRLDYVTENEPLGTAGALRNAARVLESGPEDPVVALNGDILSGHDIANQVEHHEAAAADVTLHLVEVPDPRPFGCVPTDDAGRVLAFMEKSPEPVSRQVNAGCYVFRRRVLDEIPAGRPVSVERETFPDLLAGGCLLLGHAESAYWLDVGTPEALIRASSDVVRGVARSPAYPLPPGERFLAADAEVDPGASVSGGSAIGQRARIGPGAVVDGGVIFDDAVVESGAVVRHSAVAAHATVGARSRLYGAVVGERAQVGSDRELSDGVRIPPGTRV
ncbi:MAG: NTP transferase domain-containing protein [Propionibacteriales bacterium]|nr:NTP transferase domain-containing protein [Propionibacteriales bacterium]